MRRCLLVESFRQRCAQAAFAIDFQNQSQIALRQGRHRTKTVGDERIAMAELEVADHDDVTLELKGRVYILRRVAARQQPNQLLARANDRGRIRCRSRSATRRAAVVVNLASAVLRIGTQPVFRRVGNH